MAPCRRLQHGASSPGDAAVGRNVDLDCSRAAPWWRGSRQAARLQGSSMVRGRGRRPASAPRVPPCASVGAPRAMRGQRCRCREGASRPCWEAAGAPSPSPRSSAEGKKAESDEYAKAARPPPPCAIAAAATALRSTQPLGARSSASTRVRCSPASFVGLRLRLRLRLGLGLGRGFR